LPDVDATDRPSIKCWISFIDFSLRRWADQGHLELV